MTASRNDSAALTVTVVGFGRRLLATFIDGLLLGFFTFVLAFVLGFIAILLGMYTGDPTEPLPIERLIILSAAILSLIYYVGSWVKSGQTLGKTLVGVKIVNTDGTPLSGGKAFLRYIGYIISGIVASLGFLWLAFDRKRQGWHDKLAGTVVVDEDTKFSTDDKVKLAPKDPKPGWVWLVVWVVTAIAIPGALVPSLLLLGPFVFGAIVNLIR